MMRALVFLALLVAPAAAAGPRRAKRAAPKEVAPVVYGGVKYVAAHRLIAGGKMANGAGFVEAWDVKTRKKLWEVRVYETQNDPKLEQDVQDIFITSMKLEGDKLVVSNEHNETYEIDLASHAVKKR